MEEAGGGREEPGLCVSLWIALEAVARCAGHGALRVFAVVIVGESGRRKINIFEEKKQIKFVTSLVLSQRESRSLGYAQKNVDRKSRADCDRRVTDR